METYIKAIILSMLPIAELRGGIPYALSQEVHPVTAYFMCVLANIMAFPITYFFLQVLHPLFSKVHFYEVLFNKFVVRTRNKVDKSVEKYGFWGLMVFVMIPLPVTGAYTGSFAAWLFNFKKRQAFSAVTLGVMIAGVIVTVAFLFFREALSFFFKTNI